MKHQIESARDPVRVSPTAINIIVKFSSLPTEVEFTAVANDSEEHGRVLYQNIIDGLYGPIEEGHI